MTEQASATPAIETSAAAPAVDQTVDFETRAAELTQTLDKARREAVAASEETTSEQPVAKVDGEKPTDPTDYKATRDARMAKLRERGQKTIAESQSRKAAREVPAQEPVDPQHMRELHRRATEYERLTQLLSDPDALLDLANENGVDPGRLAESIIKSRQDPAYEAARRARKEMDPTLAEIKRDLAEMRQAQHQLAAERQAFEMRQAEEQARTQLISSIDANETPLAHAMLQTYGQEKLLHLANKLAQSIPEGSGLQAVIDTLEGHLESLSANASKQELEFFSRLFGLGSTPPKSAQPKAVKAPSTGNTLSNSLASGRSSVDENVELSQDERIKLMARHMDNMRR